MKRNLRFVFFSGLILLALSIILVSCKKDEDKNTIIKGTAYFPAGTSGDLSNSKVSIYTSWDNWVNNQPIRFTSVAGAGATVTFEMKDVLPGNYYLDVWKDIDNDAFWTINDYVGWYGSGGLGAPSLTEFQITDGQTLEFDIPMYILVKKEPGLLK